jgi:hypothetical protein
LQTFDSPFTPIPLWRMDKEKRLSGNAKRLLKM